MSKKHEFTVRKSIEVDYGHRVPDHLSKCKDSHGHRGKIEVVVKGKLKGDGPENGMVVDFGYIKETMLKYVHSYLDHKFVVWSEDKALQSILLAGKYEGIAKKATLFGREYTVSGFGTVTEIPFPPTAENLAWICFTVLSKILDRDGQHVVRVYFWETPNSVACYPAED